MIRAYDQNGKPVYKQVEREPDGTWSANVWFGGAMGPATDIRRRHGYRTRAQARNADISQ